MNISHNWLSEFVDIKSSPEQLSDALNMMGIEVEAVHDRRRIYDNFVVAKVLSKIKHPKADKLSVCQVFDGETERTVVCGAANVDAEQTIVFAKPGAIVPNGGFEISARVLRGVESNGMICSKSELLLEETSDGIWILDSGLEIGQPIGTALGLADVIYEISITPNRADALSHLGIARVIAAYENKKWSLNKVVVSESARPIDVAVDIRNTDDCARYMARVARNVRMGPSPAWMQRRLEAVGLRPRNVVVDITNYVLMECGHPLHAFDLATVEGNRIVVEHARSQEQYTTLDGKDRVLDEKSLMICDPAKRLAIAGVMGGENSSIKDSTTDVLIESAWFAPSSIRRTARRLGISSDASYRFERGTDINALPWALDRAAQLMHELAGAELDQGVVDAYPRPIERRQMTLRFARVSTILGFALDREFILELLRRLDFSIVTETENEVLLEAPSYRVDVSEEIYVIEEIAILMNYDAIPMVTEAEVSLIDTSLPVAFREPALKRSMRHSLATLGWHEIVSQNQVDPHTEKVCHGDGVELANPLGEDLSIMRSSMLGSVARIVAHNLRQGTRSIRLFEFGKTFHRASDESQASLIVSEREELILAACGAAQETEWYAREREVDFYDIKGAVESVAQEYHIPLSFEASDHPLLSARQLRVVTNGVSVGVLGEVAKSICRHYDVDKSIYVALLDASVFAGAGADMQKFKSVSAFPVMERDIAFAVETTVHSGTIKDIIVQTGSAILQGVRVFDVFEHSSVGQGKKSVAFRLHFSSDERTLRDEEVDADVQRIIAAVTQQTGAALRQ